MGIDKRTFEKIRILGPGEHRALFEFVRPESLPVFLGGLMLDNGESSLTAPCHIADVSPGAPQEVDILVVTNAATLRWELRVCNLEVDFDVHFVPIHNPEERIVVSESRQPLTASSGVVDGVWDAPSAGTLRCRFSCDSARRSNRASVRVCLC